MTSWTDYHDDISDAISDSMDVDWSANDGARAVVAWLNENRPLSASPAPEGGAVERACVVFQEAIDDFESEVADVMAEGSERADLWDREIMVNIDALKSVMSAALATREEAPAEAGDFGDALLAFLYRHGLKVALDVSEIEALRQSALRAQPPAREEAHPAARVVRKGLSTGSLFYTEQGQNADLPDGTLLYTTPPAPEAEKLRILDVVGDYLIQQYGYLYGLHHPVDRKRILAALQQDAAPGEAGE